MTERQFGIADLRQQLTELRADLAAAKAELEQARTDAIKDREAFAAALLIDNQSLRAELEQAKRERDEAIGKIREHAEHVNYYGNLYSRTEIERRNMDEQREFYKDELAKAQVCADEMAALVWKWKYKADCQRETTMALVVAARAMWEDLGSERGGAYPASDTARDIRWRVVRMQQADRQAKE